MNTAPCEVTPFACPGQASGIVAVLGATVVTTAAGGAVDLGEATTSIVADFRQAHGAGFKLIFVGVGGDAGSASHMAIDFSKNGNVRALSFDAATAVTCLGNDLGFENVFARQMTLHARAGDIAVVIGGGGADPILLNAAGSAREIGLKLITTTASLGDNPLSRLGDLNFRLPVDHCGAAAAIAQLALCHSWVDFLCGWRGNSGAKFDGQP
jgi:D-sedoheptulose 7-phosphate isomerase